jgi:hypothetical protein
VCDLESPNDARSIHGGAGTVSHALFDLIWPAGPRGWEKHRVARMYTMNLGSYSLTKQTLVMTVLQCSY